MLRGMTTFVLTADEPAKAAEWYASALGIEPYFQRDDDAGAAYVELRIGDHQHELGIMRRAYAPWAGGLGTSITYWAVDDVRASLERLLDLGATAHEPIVERGPGFVTAAIVDPFGNVLGLMENAHYLEMLAAS